MPLTNNGYNLALSKRDFVQGLEESSKTSKVRKTFLDDKVDPWKRTTTL